MKTNLLLVLLLAFSRFAQAENFYCSGTGKYESLFAGQTVSLAWPYHSQKTIVDTLSTDAGSKILVDIDKSNSDNSHYLIITVLATDNRGGIVSLSAKGSIRDTVIFTEEINKMVSQITCVPIGGTR